VEFVAFSPDGRKAYAGGFDGELHILDNTTPQLRIARTVTGFPHQLSDCTVAPDGDVFVLCQDGELLQLDADGGLRRRMGFRRQAVWDVQATAEDPSTVYLATDDGVAVASVGEDTAGPLLHVGAAHVTGYGCTRRVAAVPAGVVGVARDHRAFRLDRDGAERWCTRLPALPHTVAAAGGRVLVSTNAGAACA
jgi:outer membrane protein assembly factor BamB